MKRTYLAAGALILILAGTGAIRALTGDGSAAQGRSALEPEELSTLFDGGASASKEWTFSKEALKQSSAAPPAKPVEPPVAPAAKPVEPPQDLIEARKTWGNKAQIAKLLKENPKPKDTFTIAVIGDSELGRWIWRVLLPPGDNAFRDQLREMQKKNPDAIFHVGDFVCVATVKNYRNHIKFLDKEVSRPLISVIGNHERSRRSDLEADKTLYRAIFGDTNFSFDYNGWRFVVLDSANFKLTREQLAWLDQVLDTPLKKMVFTHVPPAFLKSILKSTEAEKYDIQRLIAPAYFNEGSEEFGEIVSKRGVLRVYMGHLHGFSTADYKGVRYVISGGGGSPLYSTPPVPKQKFAHYIIVKLGPEGVLQETVYKLDDGSFDIPKKAGR